MWTGSFYTLNFVVAVNHAAVVGPNQISLRYEEIVTTADGYPLVLDSPSAEYPFGQPSVQHEHALVSLDGNCKITKWDQYGDDAEQAVVEEAAKDLFKEYIFSLLGPDGRTRDGSLISYFSRSIFIF